MHFSVAEASQPVIGVPVVILRLIVLKLKNQDTCGDITPFGSLYRVDIYLRIGTQGDCRHVV